MIRSFFVILLLDELKVHDFFLLIDPHISALIEYQVSSIQVHLPLNFGSLFSIKAVIPSRASSIETARPRASHK